MRAAAAAPSALLPRGRMFRAAPALLLALLLAAASAAQPAASDGEDDRAAALASAPAAAAPAEASLDDASFYYVVGRRADVFAEPDSASAAFLRLDFREGLHVVEQRADGWSLVQAGRTRGWVASEALSNVWVLIEKRSRTLYLYRGEELLRRFPADVSQNPEEDKMRRARLGEREHYRIPEGVFFICGKNPRSEYYRSLMLNYPNEEHAERGLREGVISRAEYAAIVRASRRLEAPPMGTALGGAIAIHGQGSGRRRAWTRGCVALRDAHLDVLWEHVEVGTPVLVR